MDTLTHNPPYSVSGQTGKALEAARVSLESIGVSTATLEFWSMAADTLRWFQEGDTAPEYGQEIALWDADGRRVFWGNVTSSDPEWDGSGVTGYNVLASGPWWWLEMAQLTGLVADSTGEDAERPLFVFPAQDLAISIRALIDRMASLGVPIQCGQINETFPVVQMTMQGKSADAALRDMLGWIPDAMTRVNYDVDGFPALEVYRRSTAPIKVLETGTDPDLTGIPKLRTRRSLIPTSVRVQSMEVNAAGELIYTEQAAGDTSGISGVLGRQLIAVSGPGRPEYRSLTPRVGTLQTATIALTNDLIPLDPKIQGYITDFGGLGSLSGYNDVGYQPQFPRSWSGLGTYRVIAGAVTEWMKEEFGLVITRTRVSGYYFLDTYATYNLTIDYLVTNGLATVGVVGGTNRMVMRLDFDIDTVNISYPTLKVFVHPDDAALVTPVANLADNLFHAQNWTPYDGEVPLHPGATIPLPGNTLNIRGALPEWSTMRGLVTGTSLDLQSGASKLTIGAPSRLAASALIDRLARPLNGRVINL